MHPYLHDLSPLIDINYTYPYLYEEQDDENDTINQNDTVSETISPLPLCMDWSPPPPNWNGPNTLWPHTLSSWTFSSTIPSWLLVPQSTSSSDPVVVSMSNRN
jgi:hypothetical protein